MKLNHDCVRDLLLFAEEHLTYESVLNPAEIKIGYSAEEQLYAADKLLEAGYLEGSKRNFIGSELPGIYIKSITWSGHIFLDNIRDDTVWRKTKSIVGKFSSASITLIGNVAYQVLMKMIESQLQLPL